MGIRIGIYGYGNLGKGVEYAIRQNPDMELVAVFTRRDPLQIRISTPNVPVVSSKDVRLYKKEIDVMIICGGSATDLPEQTPRLAEHFSVVDSFDTHANIPTHLRNVHASARHGKNVAIISVGWDPGLFSLNRFYSQTILPTGDDYTFWGEGVSQGHSDAIRRIEGVIDAKQYTIPVKEHLDAVRNGSTPILTPRQKHKRVCYVVADENADKKRIENEIKSMPNYFAGYDTTVNFITQQEMLRSHSGMPHGGSVIRSGRTGVNNQNRHIIEYSLKLGSNPEFTASVLVAFARAAYRFKTEKNYGCKTILDIPPIYLSAKPYDDLVKRLL